MLNMFTKCKDGKACVMSYFYAVPIPSYLLKYNHAFH